MPSLGNTHWSQNALMLIDVMNFRMSFGSTRSFLIHSGCVKAFKGTR